MAEPVQYRAKLQTFSHLPPEVTVQKVSFDRDVDRYQAAASRGFVSAFPGARKQRDGDRKPSPESLEITTRRAKKMVRLRVKELAPEALVTFTTRRTYSLDQVRDIWARFCRLLRDAGLTMEYVAVPEPHPSNPEHLHLHAACRGVPSISTLRRLWHIALEAAEGRRVMQTLRGADAPGNIDVQRIRCAQSDLARRVSKIAKYISKYISKDMIEAFGKRRYWHSRGFSVDDAKVYWLDSLDYSAAVLEALCLFGGAVGDLEAMRPFMPSDRVAWWVQDPEKLTPPF